MGFKPKDDSASRVGRNDGAQFNKERFIESVFRQEYVLVVGSGVIMNLSEEPTGDVNHYILRAVNGSLGSHYEDFDTVIRYAGGADPIRNLLNSPDDFSYELGDISPELRDLLSTRLFPTVLTTTFDHYLETLMRSIWGERLRVVNIDDSASLKDWRDALLACRENDEYVQPTLFYIFGKAEKDGSRSFVRTENDAIRIIEKWMQMPGEDAILQYIRSRKLLSLGCKFEDWYFRTFWYVLKHDFNRFGEGEVTMEIDESDRSDKNLQRYMERMRIYNHGDARAFMREIYTDLTSMQADNPFRAMVQAHRRRGGVFLSYCSADALSAARIFVQLCRAGYKVWFDNDKLLGGDSYDKEIRQAIEESPVVITVLSPTIAGHLAEGKETYYRKEWQMASASPEKAIIPVAVDGYNPRAAEHAVFEEAVGRKGSVIDLTRPDGLHRLTQSLDKYLGCHE